VSLVAMSGATAVVGVLGAAAAAGSGLAGTPSSNGKTSVVDVGVVVAVAAAVAATTELTMTDVLAADADAVTTVLVTDEVDPVGGDCRGVAPPLDCLRNTDAAGLRLSSDFDNGSHTRISIMSPTDKPPAGCGAWDEGGRLFEGGVACAVGSVVATPGWDDSEDVPAAVAALALEDTTTPPPEIGLLWSMVLRNKSGCKHSSAPSKLRAS
jgi:hypothetical protein